MNRSRAKIDKENENKDIRRKLKNIQARVHSNILYNPALTSNERTVNVSAKNSARLTEVAKVTDMSFHSERRASPPSPSNRPVSQSQARRSTKDDSNTLSQYKPLSMYMTSSFNQKSRPSNRQKKSRTKGSILPAISDNEPLDDANKSSRSNKSVHELYTPRNNESLTSSSSDLRSRCSSSSRIPIAKQSARNSAKIRKHETFISNTKLDLVSLSSGSTTYLNLDLDLCSLPSPKSNEDIFYMAPLIPAPSVERTTLNSPAPLADTSATLIRKFRNVLEQEERSMPEADINVVKNVLKVDERVNLLKTKDPDPKLFRDVLKTQLGEIVKSEKVVKNALRMLGGTPHIAETQIPIEVINVSPLQRHKTNDRKCRSPTRKTKVKLGLQSTDSSPFGRSSYEHEECPSHSRRRHDVATDTFSMKDFTPRHEIMSAYSETRTPRKTKYTKLIAANTGPQEEFEEFVRSTLPLKQKSTSLNRGVGQQLVRRQQEEQDDLKMNIIRGFTNERDEFSRAKDQRKPQVDVTFKNVPSVEKEILILKALGKRLEDTLKRSVSEPSLSDSGDKDDRVGLQQCSSSSSLTRELKKIDPSIEVFPGRRTYLRTPVKPLWSAMNILPWTETSAGSVIFSRGLRFEIGIVNEFIILAKTINELLNEGNQEFFIPSGKDPDELLPLSVKKLAEQPQMLMQHLKPKNPTIPFNLLDQNPMFFNSFLLPNLRCTEFDKQIKSKSTLKDDTSKHQQPKIREGGDSLLAASDGIRSLRDGPSCSKYSMTIDKMTCTSKFLKRKCSKTKDTIKELPASSTPSQRALYRRRIRREITPMPPDAFDDPKNNLLKTILVGAVQVSIFLVMIMAITYPDIKC